MLETVTIQNFKSLKNVTLNLQKVNLLIGPNNSGKSNFLKGFTFIKDYLNQRIPATNDFNRIYFNQNDNKSPETKEPMLFEFAWKITEGSIPYKVYHLELFGYSSNNRFLYNELTGLARNRHYEGNYLAELDSWTASLEEFYILFCSDRRLDPKKTKTELLQRPQISLTGMVNFGLRYFDNRVQLLNSMPPGLLLKNTVTKFDYQPKEYFDSIKIYKPDPAKISKESLLLFDKSVNEDCSNLVAFLDNMRDEHPKIWHAIEADLRKCLPEFEGINFGKVSITDDHAGRQEGIGKRFGLRNKWGKTYWAEELSEGTIYFLALLAIIHQPEPPKLLLLEEPEKGIHPRRISEVMNLIFRLAEEKDIQIILTTHSTQVVDEFQDIPESVFVFNLEDGQTTVKNLLTDIIEPDNQMAQKMNYPKLDFSKHSLGEHWAIGFLGGVPAK